MKKLSMVLFTSCLLSFPAFAEDFATTEDAEKKLSSYSVADMEGDKKRLADKQELKIDQMFNDLEACVKLLEKKPMTDEMALQMSRVSLITFINDPSAFAIDIILPAYQKNKALFEKAAQKLHPVDRAVLLDTLKNHDKANKEGEG
jgi:hypothetical protein